MNLALSKVFPGIGRCIDCSATDGISREHIIAFNRRLDEGEERAAILARIIEGSVSAEFAAAGYAVNLLPHRWSSPLTH
jgi:hypothetical protein